MRVAVYLPSDHPEHGGGVDGPAPIAYRLGRIEDGVHNHILHTGETIPLDEFVQGLVTQARAEFPDAQVRIERLIDNGDGTGSWIAADEFDPERHAPVGPGNIKSTEVSVTSEQTGGDA